MPTGKIRMWNNARGFGFIESANSRDVFVHFSEIKNKGPDFISPGDRVEFELGADREGRLLAKNARVLDQPTTECGPVRFGDIGADEAA